jgi:hypothetical protein
LTFVFTNPVISPDQSLDLIPLPTGPIIVQIRLSDLIGSVGNNLLREKNAGFDEPSDLMM